MTQRISTQMVVSLHTLNHYVLGLMISWCYIFLISFPFILLHSKHFFYSVCFGQKLSNERLKVIFLFALFPMFVYRDAVLVALE